MKVNTRIAILIAGLMALITFSFSGCGDRAPEYQLELIPSFRLNMPNVDLDKYFVKVTDVSVTPDGGFIIVDVAGPGVLRFDENGNYINNLAGFGSGNYEALCSAQQVDTTIAVHTLQLLEFLAKNGKPSKRHFLRGRGDITVAPDGRFVLNRMYDSRIFGACLEIYDTNGKLVKSFRTPRAREEGKEMLDFAYSRLTPESNIVYVQAIVDSAFVYDFDGNLLLAKKLESELKPYGTEEDTPGSLVEDVFVNEDGIFIVRVKKELTDEKIVYFDLIEQYDFNLNRVAQYTLAKPVTMTVPVDIYSPWYHKFVVKDDVFYFMVSQPFEQFIAFRAKK